MRNIFGIKKTDIANSKVNTPPSCLHVAAFDYVPKFLLIQRFPTGRPRMLSKTREAILKF